MLNRLPLARQAELVRRGEVSPLELLEAHLSQIERINPVLNAFVFQFGNEARSAAKRLFDETKPNSGSAGPLFGVPVTVKDSFDVEGCPTYCG
jgi:Asp-tRNA(Asn)/Glu-tRNA(Gln) amidotransferase A subunit family amidase